MTVLTEKAINKITYTSSKHEVTNRDVIPTFVPSNNVKVIDVTELNEADRTTTMEYLIAYQQYQEEVRKEILTFEQFINNTQGVNFTPKWRTLTIDNIKSRK